MDISLTRSGMLEYRQQLGYVENCRLVFGEADGMPQLIIR